MISLYKYIFTNVYFIQIQPKTLSLLMFLFTIQLQNTFLYLSFVL